MWLVLQSNQYEPLLNSYLYLVRVVRSCWRIYAVQYYTIQYILSANTNNIKLFLNFWLASKIGDPCGIRTHDTAVKGQWLNHLSKGPNKDLAINVVQEPGRFSRYKEISIGSNTMAPRGYSANPTFSLTGSRSTLELARHSC